MNLAPEELAEITCASYISTGVIQAEYRTSDEKSNSPQSLICLVINQDSDELFVADRYRA